MEPNNSDAYGADGEEFGSKLGVAAFDRNGQLLQQWVLHPTKTEMEAGQDDSLMVPLRKLVVLPLFVLHWEPQQKNGPTPGRKANSLRPALS